MSRIEEERAALLAAPDRDAYLRANSRLPGPRGNLELAHAASALAGTDEVERWLASTDEFIVFCGVLTLGRLGRVDELRPWASDGRWRVREAVATGLQLLGDADRERFRSTAAAWADGTPFEQRAALAGICEPRLLDAATASLALELLDRVTVSFTALPDRRSDGAVALRKALCYCWSVAIAADPERGKPKLERWAASGDPDVRRIVRDNLGKSRLARVDQAWTDRLRAELLTED